MDRDRGARHAGLLELGDVDGLEVDPELAAAAGSDEVARELRGDVAADLVAAGPDRGPEPGAERPGLRAETRERANGFRRYVLRRTAPAGVRGPDDGGTREEDRDAVRRLDDESLAASAVARASQRPTFDSSGPAVVRTVAASLPWT